MAKSGQAGSSSRPDAAEQVAVLALNFLAADAERLGGFLAATGIGPANLRQAAREPQFLAGVLRHLMRMRRFCWHLRHRSASSRRMSPRPISCCLRRGF